jgi:hypothetical protein
MVATLKYKILSGVLLSSLVVSSGVAAYFYKSSLDRQEQINNLLSEAIVTWVREMNVAGYLLHNATTNAALAEADSVFVDAQDAANTLWVSDSQAVYSYMALAPGDVAENLFPYCVGTPTDLKYINQTAIEMFAVLSAKVQNLTSLFDMVELAHLQETAQCVCWKKEAW